MSQQPADLVAVLADLYPDLGSIRRVAEQAGLAVTRVGMDGPALDVWAGVLQAERRQRKRGAVLRVALREYGANEELVAAALCFMGEGAPPGTVSDYQDWSGAPAQLAQIRTDIELIKQDQTRMKDDIGEIKQLQTRPERNTQLLVLLLIVMAVILLLLLITHRLPLG